MPEAFFDTTFFIDVMKGDRAAAELWQQVRAGSLNGYYSSLTLTELLLSPYSTPAEEFFFEGIFALLTEVPVDADIARYAGYSLRPFPVAQARRLMGDALIGCSALQRNIPLYTRNIRDMENFAGAIRRY